MLYHPHPWTEKEQEYVRTHYKGDWRTAESISQVVQHSANSVKKMAYRLGLGRSNTRYWTPEEIEKAVELVGQHGVRKASETLKRSENSISCKLQSLNISTRIRDGYFNLTETAKILGVCDEWVRNRIKEGRLVAEPINGIMPKTGGAWYRITEKSLKQFIIDNATLLNGRNVDLSMFVYLFTRNNGNGWH